MLIVALLATTVACSADRSIEDGIVAFKNGEFDTAVTLLAPAGAQGDADAQRWLALAYAGGLGVERDRERAVELVKSSAGDRAAERFFHIAVRFEKGDVFPKDEREAVAWYTIAAEAGHEGARTVLADAYRDGRLGLPVN